jgi:hypothetical protein
MALELKEKERVQKITQKEKVMIGIKKNSFDMFSGERVQR